MPRGLDTKDRKILAQLDENCRRSLKEIGRKVKLTKEGVYYRIRNLEEKGIITGYTTLISLAKLGLMQIKLLLRFRNMDRNKKREITHYFINHENTNWVGSCKGSYDYMVGFVVKDLISFNRIKEDLMSRYSDLILSSTMSIMLEGHVLGRKYLGETSPRRYIGRPEKIRVDDIDLKILKLLSKDARMRSTEIAAEIGITARQAGYRIRTMEKDLIQKYTISIDHSMVGMSFFKTFIYLNDFKDKKKILSFLAQNRHCVHDVEVLSEWDLEPEFEVPSNKEFYSIIEELEDRFSSSIRSIDTVLVEKEFKYELF